MFCKRICFSKVFVFKGHFNLKNSSVEPTSLELALNNGQGSLLLLHFYKLDRDGFWVGVGLSPQPNVLQIRGDSGATVLTEHTHVLQMAVGRWKQVLSSSGWWDGGLRHSQLLSQVIEASDVVHAALTHHTSKLRVHFCHIRKATGLKGIMGVAVQEARTKQSCAARGARGG